MKNLKSYLITLFAFAVFIMRVFATDSATCSQIPPRFQTGVCRISFDDKECVANEFRGILHVDFNQQQARLDVIQDITKSSGNLSVWMNFKEKSQYEFDHKNRKCQKKSLENVLGSNVFPSDTQLIGTHVFFFEPEVD
eukprot:TRINITY_DN17933_c0_g1_i1.p1 TRINITY_DN17933_c0_g1~~TRINITY_DN17933_c0_g1_i1.p1  ORF type:complete len:138 (-),score=28.73 TRINITY_DN17933_c0_g1_i1:133-546(-)